MSVSALDPMTLHYHVEQLLARYVHCIDGDELEQWPMLFTEKCLYRVIAKENADRNLPIAAMYCDSRAMLSDRVISLRHANIYEKHQYRHIVSSLRVEARADGTIDARSNYVVTEHAPAARLRSTTRDSILTVSWFKKTAGCSRKSRSFLIRTSSTP